MRNLSEKSKIGVIYDSNCESYPSPGPFNPPKIYPEYRFGKNTDKNNMVYDMVRNLLIQLELDQENIGTKNWNPFKNLIRPNNLIVIKPNLVKHFHPDGEGAVLSSITNGAVIRPIIDYIMIALQGQGKIIICDTPLETTNFEEVLKITGIVNMVRHLKEEKNYPLEIRDLRKYRTYVNEFGHYDFLELEGDPDGYCSIDLGQISEFAELDQYTQNYVTLSDHSIDHLNPFLQEKGVTNGFHNPERHEYIISKTILSADVIISIPKLKTHKKAGVTLNLKNMIGIVPEKVCMPHHRLGSPPYGDAFPIPPSKAFLRKRNIKRKIKSQLSQLNIGGDIIKFAKKTKKFLGHRRFSSTSNPIEWGDWYGNDTIWRTILDLNKILLYADKEGIMTSKQQRRYFSVIDGIIGQEGEGPMSGIPKICSTILGGGDGVAVDTVASILMGFDPSKIKMLEGTKKLGQYYLGQARLDNIEIRSNIEKEINFKFKPPRGWIGHIESEESC
jgi:uncharacterized protein (DUF362 family)